MWQSEAATELTLSASPTTAVGQKALFHGNYSDNFYPVVLFDSAKPSIKRFIEKKNTTFNKKGTYNLGSFLRGGGRPIGVRGGVSSHSTPLQASIFLVKYKVNS